ncbi:hypothetical protein [Streptomyces sp. NBC_00268]|uniref:hypothetical protein n=1 Tax=Streptomyces sp. NBC_00268 TaxID=2975695 RepID=UPI00224D6766|nr:hypothetical protein [Streptomyces sp. NBC_00268]MCX5182590.1 hypothetical protein [Streptomyces sp. NBC_00268]
MTAQPTVTLAAAAQEFAAKWRSAATAAETAPALSCSEIDALARLFRVVGVPDAADEWTSEHIASETECHGHPAPDPALYYTQGNYTPAPGTEYAFSISDIARATAKLLGDGWMAESGSWGITGVVAGPYSTEFTFCIDYEDDLVIEYQYSTDDDFPKKPELPDGVLRCDAGVYLEEASSAKGLDALAERSAAAIRAVTGR